jgi:AraC-like DNA-binding protein
LEAVRGVGVAADIVRHAHARLVVGLCLAGGRRIVSGGAAWTVPEGVGFVIAPGVVHACGPCRGTGHSYLALAVDAGLFEASRRTSVGAVGEPWLWHDRAAARLLVRLAEAVSGGEGGVLELFQALVESLDLRVASVSGLHPATRRAKAAIDAAPQEALSVAALAAAAGVSPFYLERLFVRDLGVPLGEYALARRVKLAAARIGAGDPLAEAALASGFFDQSHLTRHFRRRMGVPPGKYRLVTRP